MFERFTERARQIVVLAQEEARSAKHMSVRPEHLVVGVVREEEGIGSRVLASLDYDLKEARANLGGPEADQPKDGQLPFTPAAKQCLELALREALSLGHNYIGTEHVLLGIVRSRTFFTPEFGEKVREATLKLLMNLRNPKPKRAEPQPKPERAIEFCRDCRDELSVEDALNGTPITPADFLIWGKLFSPEALGPKCYDHAQKHLGGSTMGRIDQYAVLDLRKLQRKP